MVTNSYRKIILYHISYFILYLVSGKRKRKALTNAEKQRRYRERVRKHDPEKWNHIKELSRLRAKRRVDRLIEYKKNKNVEGWKPPIKEKKQKCQFFVNQIKVAKLSSSVSWDL